MKSEKANKLLTERGYQYAPPKAYERKTTAGYYHRIDRTKDVPFCLHNEEQPIFSVKEYSKPFAEFEIGITCEAKLGWVGCKFYGLSEKEILENVEAYENTLLKMWAALFDEKV